MKSNARLNMAGKKAEGASPAAARCDSIEALFVSLESPLLVYAQRFVKQDEAAQDIVQEAFMRLHTEFASVTQPQAWLYRTVHNLALNHLRAARKIVPLDGQDGGGQEHQDEKPLPDEHLARMEAIGHTRLCLQDLDARRRELVRLKFEEGLSYKEISARTQLSISNVGYLLHHALKDLEAALAKTGVMS